MCAYLVPAHVVHSCFLTVTAAACCLSINRWRARTVACVLYRPDLGRGFRHPSITGGSVARTLGLEPSTAHGGFKRDSKSCRACCSVGDFQMTHTLLRIRLSMTGLFRPQSGAMEQCNM